MRSVLRVFLLFLAGSRRLDAECRVEIIQGGHWSMLDHPDDVNKLMVEWFEAPISTARAEVMEA